MYVLADIEWIENTNGKLWPTQLSAVRVDSEWQTIDSFSTLIRPKDHSFERWNHMAFSGWHSSDFIHAPSLYPALDGFEQWLKSDDVLCWWHHEAGDFFNMFQKTARVPDRITHVLYLNEYIYNFLNLQKTSIASPYKLCNARSIPVPSPSHCSDNDVLTIQRLLCGIGFPQDTLLDIPAKNSIDKVAIKGSNIYPLIYDPESKLLHRSDCELLPDNIPLPAFNSYKTPLLRWYKPCSCCHEEYLDRLWDKNRDTIARSYYNYVYSAKSKVFHKRDCSYILLASNVQGCVSYDECIGTGRRPCKHCFPVTTEIETTEPTSHTSNAQLSIAELSAIGRFKRAKEERMMALSKGVLTEDKRKNLMALTQPGLAFWASKGHRTFHSRNCPKIAGLNQLRGFSRYQDAIKAGYAPCRQCKPNPKQNVVYSIPITNRERSGENVNTLVDLCSKRCLPFEYDNRYFIMQTTAGKWRIDMSRIPIHLEHINFVTTPGNTTKFHTQPRLFLSFKDAFDYIIRHDSRLIEEMTSEQSITRSAIG